MPVRLDEATEKVLRELDFIKRVEKQDFLLFFYLENEMFKQNSSFAYLP